MSAAFQCVETRESGNITVELLRSDSAWLVVMLDTDAGELIEARGCPSEQQARACFERMAMEGAAWVA